MTRASIGRGLANFLGDAAARVDGALSFRADDVFGITDRGVAHRGMRIAHANFAIRIWGDIAVVTGNSMSGSFTAIRIAGFDAIFTDNIVSKNGSGIVSRANNSPTP